jgi:hypothetical protein
MTRVLCVVSHSSDSTCVTVLRPPGRSLLGMAPFRVGSVAREGWSYLVLVSFRGELQCAAMDDDNLDELVAHSPGPDGPPRVGSSELASDAGKHPTATPQCWQGVCKGIAPGAFSRLLSSSWELKCQLSLLTLKKIVIEV